LVAEDRGQEKGEYPHSSFPGTIRPCRAVLSLTPARAATATGLVFAPNSLVTFSTLALLVNERARTRWAGEDRTPLLLGDPGRSTTAACHRTRTRWREASLETSVAARQYAPVVPGGWLGLDWGNVPSWVGTVLTSSSLGLAAFTYFRSSRDRRRQLDDAERSQAARVSMWWVNPRRAVVRNGNDVAVTVQAVIADGPETSSERLGLGPGEDRDCSCPAGSTARLGACSCAWPIPFGRSWIRGDDGTLERVNTPTVWALAERPTSRSGGLRWEDR
jgi:hypothetical protein